MSPDKDLKCLRLASNTQGNILRIVVNKAGLGLFLKY